MEFEDRAVRFSLEQLERTSRIPAVGISPRPSWDVAVPRTVQCTVGSTGFNNG
jgi:hypothetical protein